jgi:hypothetical protein
VWQDIAVLAITLSSLQKVGNELVAGFGYRSCGIARTVCSFEIHLISVTKEARN